MYYCNCMDAVLNHTICKHIHLVAQSTRKAEVENGGAVRMEEATPLITFEDEKIVIFLK